jgi:MFS family permease
VARRIAVDLTVLRESRDLRLLTIGQTFASVGTQAVLVAIPFQIYTLTHSAALVGLVGAAELGPLILGSLLGGAWADRHDRRSVLLFSQAAECAVAGALAACAFSGDPPVPLVFVLAAMLAGVGAVVNVARSAAVPALSGERVRSALSINFGVSQLASIIGPAIGGLVIGAWGVEAVYAGDAAGFAILFAATVAMRPLPPGLPGEEVEPVSLRRSIAEGLRFVRGNRTLVGSFAIDLAAMTFGMPRALFAVLALTVYDAGASGTGLLYASVSAGATLAVLTTGWIEHARWLGRITVGAVLVWGAAIAAAGLMPSLAPAALLLAVAGAADSVSAVCRTSINQAATPESMRGRMSAVFMLVVTSGPRLGDVESGLAASAIGAQAAVVTGGLACIGAVGLIVAAFPQLVAYDGRQPMPGMAPIADAAEA